MSDQTPPERGPGPDYRPPPPPGPGSPFGPAGQGYGQPPYSPSASRSGMTAVWVVLGVLAGVLLLGFAGCAALVVSARGAVDGALDELSEGVPAPAPSAEPPLPVPSAAPSAAPEQVRPQGTLVEVGDYLVTISAFTPDATAPMLAAGNPDPVEGQYAVITVEGTYVGPAQGAPFLELSAGLIDVYGITYDDSQCPGMPADSMFSQGPVSPNEQFSGTFCVDIPPSALDDDAVLYIDSLLPPGSGQSHLFVP